MHSFAKKCTKSAQLCKKVDNKCTAVQKVQVCTAVHPITANNYIGRPSVKQRKILLMLGYINKRHR